MAKHTLITEPMVSICIPAYNCARYIQETLNCLCSQTYQNMEIIVVNDGSTDNTEAIAKSINDKRIKLFTVKNGGAAKARNVAYNNAKGDYIIFFDADDFVKPDFLASQIKKMDGSKSDVVLSLWGRFYHGDLSTFKQAATPVDKMTFAEWIKFYWYRCNPMTNPGRALIPAVLVENAGLWNETLSLNDDLEFFTRLFLKAKKIIFNHDATLYYRSGINGLSAVKSEEAYRAAYVSLDLSIKYILAVYPHDDLLLKSCANMWQLFIYDLYPEHKKLITSAAENVRLLGGSDFKFPSGGYTKSLVSVIGWKNTKRIKRLFKR